MKTKTIFTLAALCMAVAANATILRVSNVSGSSAPYSTIETALEAAQDGDTIAVDGSPTVYSPLTIRKQVVLLGPGYWHTENGLISGVSIDKASVGALTINAEGVVLCGLELTEEVTINKARVVVNRCLVRKGIKMAAGADNCIIHQNYFTDTANYSYLIKGANNGATPLVNYTQVTNNIFYGERHRYDNDDQRDISYLNECLISHNTWTHKMDRGNIHTQYTCMDHISGSTIDFNIMPANDHDGAVVTSGSSNVIENNYMWGDSPYGELTPNSDLGVKNAEATWLLDNPELEGHGAFYGDSPYVISGIPAAPVIQGLAMPTTVEKGKKMNVTIKVGIQR